MAEKGISETEFGIAIFVVLLCITSCGFASGLTQVRLYPFKYALPEAYFKGLLSLDPMELQIKARSGSDKEKKQAEALLPIIANHHLLLVSVQCRGV